MGQQNFSPQAEGVFKQRFALGAVLVWGIIMSSCAASESNKRGFVQKNVGSSADAAAVAQSSALEPAAGSAPVPSGEGAPKAETPKVEKGDEAATGGTAAAGSPGSTGGPPPAANPTAASPESATTACVSGATASEFGRVNAAAGVNVRAKALVDAERIGGFDDKTKVSIWKSVGTAPNAWLCVSGQDHLGAAITGWVSAPLIERVATLSSK